MATQRLAWFLTSVLVVLCAIFILLSVLAPEVMGRALAGGHVLSLGMAAGLLIIIVAIVAALCFEHRLNRDADRRP